MDQLRARGALSSPVTLQLGTLIGIIVAAGIPFCICLAGGLCWLVKYRHKKRAGDVEKEATQRLSNTQVTSLAVAQPQRAATRSGRLSFRANSRWEAIPSIEDLRKEAETQNGNEDRAATRHSILRPAWPLSRRSSRKHKSARQAKIKPHLSAIIESPQALSAAIERTVDLPQGDWSNSESASEPVQDDYGFDQLLNSELSSILAASSRFSLAMKPPFALSDGDVFEPQGLRTKAGRTFSVPSILFTAQTSGPSSLIKTAVSNNRRSRSASLGNLPLGEAPSGPLPPLPRLSTIGNIMARPALSRNSSRSSLTSMESAGSSILKCALSPRMKVAADFQQRHPDLGLGGHIRQEDTELKDALIAGRAPRGQVSSGMRFGTRLISSQALLTEGKSIAAEDCSSVSAMADPMLAADTRTLSASERTPGTSPSRGSADFRTRETPIKVLSAPARVFPMRRVSDSGSPAERRRLSLVPKHTEDSPLGVQKSSKPPEDGHSSVGLAETNIFQFDTPPKPTTRRSALKGSPNARQPGHKRSAYVRIKMQPQVMGPPSRSGSSTQMLDIVEEVGERASQDCPDLERSVAERCIVYPKPPSAIHFAPVLDSYRASLTPSSPTLSLNDNFHFDDHAKIFRRPSLRGISLSPTRTESARLSNASSFLIPAFPEPAHTGNVNGAAKPSAKEIEASPRTEPAQAIPGLTLIEKSGDREYDLQFPMLDLGDSPGTDLSGSPNILTNIERPAPLHIANSSKSTALPLSPPCKASPTTQLFEGDVTIKPIQLTPLSSSVELWNTKPIFDLPSRQPSPPRHVYPNGPRTAPPPEVRKSINQLRRMDSETLASVEENPGARRFMRLGREASPDLSSSPDLHSSLTRDSPPIYDSEKENCPWDDGMLRNSDDGFWDYVGRDAKQDITPEVTRTSGKRVAWGGVEVRERTASATPGSLYDVKGFLQEEQ